MAKHKRYKYKLWFKLLLWSLAGMIIFSIAAVLMNRPSTAVIVKPSLEDNPRAEGPAKTNVITTKYFRLAYDAGLDTVSDISAGDKTALEVYRVARSDTSGRRTFVITIKPLPVGGMSEESSYKLRQINPGTYRESHEIFGGDTFTVMEKLDGSELTAFSSHGGRLAMLAYTLDTPGADLRAEAAELLGSFDWLN